MENKPKLSKAKALIRIMNHYGEERQLEQFIEECSEAIVAIQKIKRYGYTEKTLEDFKSELADVLIMGEQMYNFFNDEGDIDRIINRKLFRQIERIEKGEE